MASKHEPAIILGAVIHWAALALCKVAFICGLKMQERLGLSTSCSATFRQLLVFRATFFVSSNFLHSEQFLWLASNVLVKSKLQHPPRATPRGIWLFWKLLFKFPPIRAKMPFKCPALGSIQVIKCPHPGHFFFHAHFKMAATYRCRLVTSMNTRFGTGIYQKNLLTPGTFRGHINDRRKAETPSVVEQNLYKYSK